MGHTLTYHYDNQRRLIRLTNENGEDWTFTYDKADNLISETRFDGTTAHYDYSKAGLLKHQLDTGLHYYYRYDRAGQLTDKYSLTDRHHLNKSYLTPKHPNHSDPYPYAYSDSDYQHHRQPILDKNRPHRLRYQYDMAGQLIRATSPHATTTLGYDPVGQLISETLQRHHSHAELGENETDSHSTLSQTLTHAYDELGNRIKTTLPDGKALNQLYYGSGHLYNQSLTDESGNIQEIRHSTTNPLHQEVTRQQGELLSSFGYDPMGRLTKQYSSNDSHIVIQRDYAYDKVGQLTHIASKTRLTQLVPNKPTQTIVTPAVKNGEKHMVNYVRQPDDKSLGTFEQLI